MVGDSNYQLRKALHVLVVKKNSKYKNIMWKLYGIKMLVSINKKLLEQVYSFVCLLCIVVFLGQQNQTVATMKTV